MRSAVAARSAAAQERGIASTVNVTTVEVTGDRVLLERLVGNVVENAIRHNVDGGRIEVNVSADDGDAVLAVENGGPVIADAEVAALFERFARGAEATRTRSEGYGLGLAIVRAVAQHHGGSASARALPGGGLRVEVRIPSAS